MTIPKSKLITKQPSIKKILELIKNDVDKQTGITVSNATAEADKIKAEGEGEYMRILSEAYNTADKQNFYEFTRSLDALKESLGDQSTIILGKDSTLAKALLNP